MSAQRLRGCPPDEAVLESQLCRRFDTGEVESPEALVARVATTLAEVERSYGAGGSEVAGTKQEFERLMLDNLFWPSGRILNNAGTRQGQLASCFVLPVRDDFDALLETVVLAARCHRAGGGTGFDVSSVREAGAAVSTSELAGASGPLPWIRLLDVETSTVMAGGKMRGANLASLSVYHPDVMAFIASKESPGNLSNFNLSVAIDDAFMAALEEEAEIDLVSPATGATTKRVPARTIWEAIAAHAWQTGDPGALFLDAIDRSNSLRDALGPILTTNPCGEQTLYPFEASNLGSINLASFYDPAGDVFWEELRDVVQLAVRLLDNAIDACRYPDPRITQLATTNRRLGLGVMGFADLLVKLGIPYDSDEALLLVDRLGRVLHDESRQASAELAAEREPFPNFPRSSLERPVRNCAVTSIAPTGTISMIAGCSPGIEPRFAPAYTKHVIRRDGVEALDGDLVAAVEAGLGVERTEAERLVATRPPEKLGLEPDALRPFRYAHDVSGPWHVAVSAAWQRWIDNAVSKTVNLPTSARMEDVEEVFSLAWRSGCKGIALYRAGSRSVDLQVAAQRADDQPVIQSREIELARVRR